MKRRHLSSEDLDLWQKVVETAERLEHIRRPAVEVIKPPQAQSKISAKRVFNEFTLGSRISRKPSVHDLKQSPSQKMALDPLRMDEKAYRRMKRGKLRPDGKLDLHGMRVEAAHSALTRFVLSSHASGKRLILVITGKGKDRDGQGPIPVPRGILRHQVPQWLALAPLASVVLQITPAHISHGGEGAYYVYLRKFR